METGVSTASLFGRYNTEDAVRVLADAGVPLIEVSLSTFSEYEPAFAEQLARIRGGVRVHSVHALTTQFEPQLFNASARVRADAEAIFRKVLEAGRILGAKYYTFHGAMRLKTVRYEYDFDRIAATVNRLADIAAEYGLTLSYENVHWCWFSYPGYFAELKKRSPVCATLDVKQAVQSRESAYDYLDVVADRLTTVHLCDCVGVETALPGRGEFDFARFIAALKKKSVTAPLILEAYSKDYADTEELISAYEYIKGLAE